MWWVWILACEESTTSACPEEPLCTGEQCSECALVGTHSDVEEATCVACLDATCDDDALPPEGCEGLPCSDGGRVVVQACACDEDCEPSGLLCGQYTGLHGVCVTHDDL